MNLTTVWVPSVLICCDFVCQVLELLRRRGQYSEENFDAMGLLQTLCLVKMDTVDGNTAAKKQAAAKTNDTDPGRSSSAPNEEAAESMDGGPNLDTDRRDKVETEMKGKSEHTRDLTITTISPATPVVCMCVCVHFYIQHCQ